MSGPGGGTGGGPDRSAGGGPDRSAVAAAVRVLGDRALVGMPLGPLTTYRVGGPAAVGVVARGLGDLQAVAVAAEASGLGVLVVGRGSNMLVADTGYPGIALLLDPDAFATLDVEGRTVRAGAALPLPALARRTVDVGLSGLEWAVGVPGSVGGGVRMNAGGHGSDMAGTLVRVRVADLATAAPELVSLGPAELALGYRRSALAPLQVVVDADFELVDGDREVGRATIRGIVRWRREHQPGGQNAGSVFVNPSSTPSPPATVPASPGSSSGRGGPTAALGPADTVSAPVADPGGAAESDPAGRSAGWLIDAAGLKGLRIGSAEVSPKHANFIQADPGGSAADVRAVMEAVRSRVAQRWGVDLRTEIRLIGFPQLSTSSRGTE
jgi:UDP-N-acetylmuramate dehydrogenase